VPRCSLGARRSLTLSKPPALVEFSSGEAGDYYESSNVSEAIFIALPGLGKGTEC
jgi:hypothetical protein